MKKRRFPLPISIQICYIIQKGSPTGGTDGPPLLLGQGFFDGEVDSPVLRRQNQDLDGLPCLEVIMYVLHEKMQEIARRELGWVLPGEYVFEVGS